MHDHKQKKKNSTEMFIKWYKWHIYYIYKQMCMTINKHGFTKIL